MRHAVRSRRLGRSRSERAALVRSLAQALFRYERIHTTLPKAKEAQRAAERLITRAKAGTLTARRSVESWIQDPEVTKTLFAEIAPRFKQRPGGYTRIVHAGRRNGDGATMAILELVERKPASAASTAPKPTSGKPARGTKPERPQEPPKRKRPEGPESPTATPPTDEKPPPSKKPGGFLGGLRKFFKKGRPEGD